MNFKDYEQYRTNPNNISPTQQIQQGVGGARIFAPSKVNPSLDILDTMSAAFGGQVFNSVADFINYYKSDAFRIAYANMDPLTCYTLASGNTWVSGAIEAISQAVSTAEIVGSPDDPNHTNEGEIEYINELFEAPNEEMSGSDFKEAVLKDVLVTGNAYVEKVCNKWGVPLALYRHPPYDIIPAHGIYIYKRNVVFTADQMLHVKLFNPFHAEVGMSPLVSLVAPMMLDSSILKSSLKYFDNNVLKGILNIDPSVGVAEAERAANVMRESIRQAKAKGEQRHLIAFATTFQSMASSNRDMMTPELEESVKKRVMAMYRVPPAKMMDIESGNIGGGTHEGQSDSMNDTAQYWADKVFKGPFTRGILRPALVHDTHLEFTNLTKSDDMAQADLKQTQITSGQLTLNEGRTAENMDSYENPLANEPLIPNNLVPLSLVPQMLAGKMGGNSQLNEMMKRNIQQKVTEIFNE